jgi:hypothetical protein
MAIPHLVTGVELFRTYTTITLGDDKSMSFWHDIWLQGMTPREIAPLMFRLAGRKNNSVAIAITDGQWMK